MEKRKAYAQPSLQISLECMAPVSRNVPYHAATTQHSSTQVSNEVCILDYEYVFTAI